MCRLIRNIHLLWLDVDDGAEVYAVSTSLLSFGSSTLPDNPLRVTPGGVKAYKRGNERLTTPAVHIELRCAQASLIHWRRARECLNPSKLGSRTGFSGVDFIQSVTRAVLLKPAHSKVRGITLQALRSSSNQTTRSFTENDDRSKTRLTTVPPVGGSGRRLIHLEFTFTASGLNDSRSRTDAGGIE
jgi:hypothetical protein